MTSIYLQPSDYANFGVPAATAMQVMQASALIDGYLDRPAGLLWTAGGDGQPCYMTSLSPDLVLTSTTDFGPGPQITVPVTGALKVLQIGDCLTIDRATSAKAEVVQVVGIDVTNGTVTLGTLQAVGPSGVQFTHTEGALLERGLQIEQTKDVPTNRPLIQLNYTPVSRIIGGSGRYGYGRRANDASLDIDDFNLLASLQKFGGPPAWEIWPANTATGVEPNTGNLWVPAGVMLAYYSEVSIRYVAGFGPGTLPDSVKMACAQLINAQSGNPLLGNIKSQQAGGSKIEYLTASYITPDVQMMLAPLKSSAFA